MVHALPSAYLIENRDHVLFPTNAGKPENRLAHHFLRRISKDALGTAVPASDDAFYRLSDDCVLGGFNDCRQALQPFKFDSRDEKFFGRADGTLRDATLSIDIRFTAGPSTLQPKALRRIVLARSKRDLVAATERPASSATSFTGRSLH
jgi:hypothetical protein